jgi:hypothetical protein
MHFEWLTFARCAVAASLLMASAAGWADPADARGNGRAKAVRNGGNGLERVGGPRVQGFVARGNGGLNGGTVYFEPARRNDLSSGARVRLFFDQFTSS